MIDAEDSISLRPRIAAGGNPFASFGKGAGFGIKTKKVAAAAASEESAVKRGGKRVKYGKEFLMQFMERFTKCPLEITQLGLTEIVISEESDRTQQRQVLQKVAEEIDDRDWRARDAAVPLAPETAALPARTPPAARDAAWERAKPSAAGEAEPKGPASPPAATAAATPAPASAAATAQPATAAVAPAPATPAITSEQASKIVRAADVGLQAYRPGAQLSAEERALRSIKGILNKLTPEKFERLLSQLLEVVTTSDLLKATISQVFESAVEQPTYCAMYAELCVRLSRELPSFPPPPGADRPLSFRQILLNTCQDEFEGTEAAREALSKIPETAAREDAERTVKKRTLGNCRLISELYKQDMVKDWIMTACMEDLLAMGAKGKVPPEDNIEATCEMITTAGGRLSKAERPETRKKLDEVLRKLEALGADTKNVASRIRFVIRDILDLRKNGWVPRRELFTAKKLDEVRAQAEAELGMVSTTINAVLPTLPAQQRAPGLAGLAPLGGADEVPLIPPLRSGAGEADGGWGLFPPLRSQAAGTGLGAAPGGGRSALLGEFTPLAPPTPPQQPQPAAVPAPAAAQAAPVAQPPQPPSAAPAGAALNEEELRRKTKSLLTEFSITLDVKEAALCVQELGAPDWMPKLVEAGLEAVLDSTKDKEQSALMDLLLHLHTKGLVTGEHLVAALTTYAAQLEDLSMDFPKGPAQLGTFIGRCVVAGAVALDALPALLEGDFSVEPKRDLAAAAFSAIAAGHPGGADALGQLCRDAGLTASSFLAPDPDLDPDAPSVEDWLASKGLKAVPV